MRCTVPGRFVNGAPPHSPRVISEEEQKTNNQESVRIHLVNDDRKGSNSESLFELL
jgi:hypothetical protein